MYCTSGYDQVTSSLNQPRFAVSITWFAVSILRFAVSTPYSLKSRLIMSGLSWVIRGFIVSSVFFSYCSIGMRVENAVKSVFSSTRAERVWERAGEGLAIGVGKLFGFICPSFFHVFSSLQHFREEVCASLTAQNATGVYRHHWWRPLFSCITNPINIGFFLFYFCCHGILEDRLENM